MLIGIEASRANRFQKTGVEWYAYELIQQMKQLPEAQDHSWLLYTNEALMQGLEKGPTNWHQIRLKWFPKYLWTQLRLSFEMYRHSPQVLWIPAHVLPRIAPKQSVVTIHDIGFHHLPHLYKPRQVSYHEWSTKDILKRAAKIITVSEFSKCDLIENYQAPAEKIFVTHLGVHREKYQALPRTTSDAILARLQIPSPYLVFVGRIESKKNVGLLLDAFARYKVSRGMGDPLHLVLIGQPGFGYEEIMRKASKEIVQSFVHVTGYVTETEKIALLSRARALVHPAFYEGFGLTPLEAMACGAPVLCSKVASLPEVIGEENALWFDPNNAESLEQQIVAIVDRDDLRQQLAERGSLHCKKYTWQETAKKTFDILTEW